MTAVAPSAWRRCHRALTTSSGGATWILAASVALWVVTVVDADYSAMGSLGLVTVLGWTYFAGLILLCLGFANELVRTPLRRHWLTAYIVLLVVYLFATASAIEPIAALADSYRHSGLLEYVFLHGATLPHYVADFSWPGAFSLGSVFVEFTGLHNPLAFTRWFPPFIELLFLAPLLAITRSVGVGRRAAWLGIALFYAADWIDQDYFSPQALGYMYLLVVMAVVLSQWRPRHLPGPPRTRFWQSLRFRYIRLRVALRLRRLLGHDAVSTHTPGQDLALFGLFIAVFFSLSISHELTPYALITMLAACLLTRQLGRPELIVIAVLITVGWLSLGASDYWIGHLSFIFGGFGHIGSTLSSNVSGRVTGSFVHQLAAETRILIIGAIYALAGVGALRRSFNSRTTEALAVFPFLILVVSSYVGEGLMRVVLYALPFTALLAASALVPERYAGMPAVVPYFWPRRLHRWIKPLTWAATLAVLLSFTMATTVARGGNDDYESYTVGELTASNYVYDHATPNATIALVAPYLPYNQRDVAEVYWVSLYTSGSPTIAQIRRQLVKLHPEYIVLSESQSHWGQIVAGLPRHWMATLRQELLSNGFRVAARFPTATVLASNALVKTATPATSRLRPSRART